MNIKALTIAIGITTTIAAVLGLLIAALIYFPITTFYIIASLLSIGMLVAITYAVYLFITEEFDIL